MCWKRWRERKKAYRWAIYLCIRPSIHPSIHPFHLFINLSCVSTANPDTVDLANCVLAWVLVCVCVHAGNLSASMISMCDWFMPYRSSCRVLQAEIVCVHPASCASMTGAWLASFTVCSPGSLSGSPLRGCSCQRVRHGVGVQMCVKVVL